MLWVLVDVLLGVLALIALAVMVLGLWRKVKDLGRELSRAGEGIGRATDELAALQAALPPAPEGPTTSTTKPAAKRAKTGARVVR